MKRHSIHIYQKARGISHAFENKAGYFLTRGLMILLLCLPISQLKARDEKYASVVDGTPTGTCITTDPAFPAVWFSTWDATIPFQQVTNHIIFRFNPQNTFVPATDLTITADLMIHSVDRNSTPTDVAVILSIEYKNGKLEVARDMQYYSFTGGHEVTVTVNSISPSVPTDFVRIENVMEIHRFFDFDPAFAPSSADISHTVLTTSSELEIHWDAIPGGEEYDLEWAHINDYGSTDLPYDFRFNSTRIRTKELEYKIPMVFEKGNLIYRYRGVGATGADYTLDNPGGWSGPETGNHVSAFPNRYHVAVPHEGDKFNWQAVTNYAEEGKSKIVVSYFDGSLRNQQIVSKINTDNMAIAGETKYDHQGRACLQILPVPAGDDDIRYYPDFNLDDGNTRPYDRRDFDLDMPGDPCAIGAKPMGTGSGTSRYYSPLNTIPQSHRDWIPDAKKYPFTQVEYTPDNTGRIRRQGGVGPDHQLGTGHETKYYYGKPLQFHLDRLFGSEVGYFSHYKKNMVVDANGQISVSYLDQQGRVIATALAGNTPHTSPTGGPRLDPLPSNHEASLTSVTADLLDNRDPLPGSNVLVSQFVYLATTAGTHDFSYTISPEAFHPECLGPDVCYDCVYNLVISVLDECGMEIATSAGTPVYARIGKMDAGGDPVIDYLCESSPLDHAETFSLYLHVGNYTILKTLTVDENVMLSYEKDYLAREGCVKTLEHFIAEELATVDYSSCDPPNCKNKCLTTLGTETVWLAAHPGATTSQYYTAVKECRADCEMPNPCEQGYKAMLADMMPGGQYARFDTATLGPIIEPASVLVTFTALPKSYFDPSLVYYDAYGKRDTLFLPGTPPRTPNQLTVPEFIRNFKRSWAETLVPLHPEYCKYIWCRDYAAAIEDYEKLIRNTQTYEEAYLLGLLNPMNIFPPNSPAGLPVYADPLFKAPHYSSLTPEYINAYLKMVARPLSSGSSAYTLNLWQEAAAGVACAELYGLERSSCFTQISLNMPPYPYHPLSATDPCTRDRVWQLFRAQYLKIRQPLAEKARKTYVTGLGGICAQSEDIGKAVYPFTFASKEKRFPTLSEMMADGGYSDVYSDATSAIEEAKDIAASHLSESCDSACIGYATDWLTRLADCNPYTTPWDALNPAYVELRQKLIAVCVAGCDSFSPAGATSVPSGHPGISSGAAGIPNYRDFDDVIRGVIVQQHGGDTSLTCNADLISFPGPHGHQYYSMQGTGLLDTCACNTILMVDDLFNEYVAAGTLPPEVTNREELFRLENGYDMLDMGRMVCRCRKAYTYGQTLPLPEWPEEPWTNAARDTLLVWGERVPAEATCLTCVTCTEMMVARDSFLLRLETAYGPLTGDKRGIYEDLLVSHLNKTFNLDLTGSDYIPFLEQCDAFAGGDFYCKLNEPEATDLEHTLDLLADPLRASMSGGTPELLTRACLCLPPYGNPPTDPRYPDGTGTKPPYTNSLVDYVNPDYDYGDSCNHLYEFGHITGLQLTGTIRDCSSPVPPCTLTLEFTDSGYLFENIIAFKHIRPYTALAVHGLNYDFLIDAEVMVAGAIDTVTLRGHSTCIPIAECTDMASEHRLCNEHFRAPEEDCRERMRREAIHRAEERYKEYADSLKQEFRAAYTAHCMKAAETFTMIYGDNEYHYTLYYYDQAGNLIRTVPPEGVELVSDPGDFAQIKADRDQGTRTFFTQHRMASTYEYNSLNQLVRQSIPDHDQTHDWSLKNVIPSPPLDAEDFAFMDPDHGFFISADPADPDKSVIYFTTNGGDTWSPAGAFGGTDLWSVQFLDASTGYVGGEEGVVLFTSDAGTHWKITNTGSTQEIMDLRVTSASIAHAYDAAGESWSTTDMGDHWFPFTSTGLTTLEDVSFASVTTGYAAGSISSGEGGLARTNNSGTTWIPETAIRTVTLSGAEMLPSSAQGFACGMDGTLLSTLDNGVHWKEIKTGPDMDKDILDLHFKSATEGVVIRQTGELMWTADGGQHWVDKTPLVAPYVDLHFINANLGFAIAADGKFCHTTDGGQNWLAGATAGVGTFRTIEFLNSSTGIVAGDGGILSRTTNVGSSWQVLTTDLPPGSNIRSIHADGSGKGCVILSSGQMYRTINLGFLPLSPTTTNWIPVTGSGFVSFSFVTPLQGLVITSNKSRTTADGGMTWSGATPVSTASGLRSVYATGTKAFALGTDGEIFTSTDFGTTWANRSNEVTPLPMHGLTAQDKLIATGENGHVYQRTGTGAPSPWQREKTYYRSTFHAASSKSSHDYVAGENGIMLKRGIAGTWPLVLLPTGSKINDLSAHPNARVAGCDESDNVISQDLAGAAFNLNLLGILKPLHAISTPENTATYTVGDDGTVYFTNSYASPWVSRSGTIQPGRLHDMDFGDAATGYAVGKGGLLLKTTNAGATWPPIASGVTADLFAVEFSSASQGFYGGVNQFRYTPDGGDTWSTVSGFTIGTIRDIELAGSGGVAVGDGGHIWSTALATGTWALAPSGTTSDVNSVFIIDGIGYAVGQNGEILKNEDCLNLASPWVRQRAPGGLLDWAAFTSASGTATETLNTVWFRDRENGYAAGSNGILLKTTDGGIRWYREDVSTTGDILAMEFPGSNGGLLGGTDYLRFLRDNSGWFSTQFWYDPVGRLSASQNSKQFPEWYSYTDYDDLGRIAEVGELFAPFLKPEVVVGAAIFPGNWSIVRREVTRTLYDRAIGTVDVEFGPEGQEHLRSRVGSVLLYDTYNGDGNLNYVHGTHYSYDVHGNVHTLLQENRDLSHLQQQFKRMEYVYDLVSGNVNQVRYQPGEVDQFYHRYMYDADNRITSVFTSSDGIQWDRDARYEYYLHGPLARMVLGDEQVQGLDYVYTLHGWIKAVNPTTLDPTLDPGHDAENLPTNPNRFTAKDAYSYSLHYYDGDYTPIGGPSAAAFLAEISGTGFGTATPDLFNGNIPRMVTTILDPLTQTDPRPQGTAYTYDQLNRITGMDAFNDPSILTLNSFSATSAGTDYKSRFTYDANGNIQSMLRNGISSVATSMDNMTYNYALYGGNKYNNRLLQVNDAVTTTIYTDDIEDQGPFDLSDESDWNYSYDEIGNLIRDRTEEIEKIEWTVYGKIKSITRTPGSNRPDLEFAYDGNGNRVSKLVKPRDLGVLLDERSWVTTYYVRDAQGNVMATYEKKIE